MDKSVDKKSLKIEYKMSFCHFYSTKHKCERDLDTKRSVWPEKIAKCLSKLAKNDFNMTMIDFDSFTKIA